jgi:hypothetical protein
LSILSTNSSRLKRLLGSGYFPKELPPVFVTTSFAKWRKSLLSDWPAKELDEWKSVAPPPLAV